MISPSGYITVNDQPGFITIDANEVQVVSVGEIGPSGVSFLTGPISAVGGATSVTAQTGTGSVFVMSQSPTLVTPNIGIATGSLLGNAISATTAVNIAGGLAGSIPYQTGAGITAMLVAAAGVLVGGATPAYSLTPTLTGTNFTGVPNAALVNSAITLGATPISLGATATTIAGLTSVSSTTFVGALTGNAATATTAAQLGGIAAASYALLASPTFTGTVTVPAPVNATDAATKGYADAIKQGLDIKDSVRAASTANVAIASALVNGLVMDGVTLATGDRVLLKNQTAAAENGIYVVVAAGAAPRSIDADTSAKVTSGMYTFTSEGATQASNGYVLTTLDPIVLGTTALVLTQFSGAGQIIAGNGLTKSGNTLSLNTTITGLTSVSSTAFVGALTGNASTATALATARAINGVNFDGTSAITVTAAAGTLTGATLASNVLASSLTSVGTLSSLTSSGVVFSSGGTISPAAAGTSLAGAYVGFTDAARTANNKIHGFGYGGGTLLGQFINDAFNATINWLVVTGGQASGITSVALYAGAASATLTNSGLAATGSITGTQLVSNVATGTAPLVVTSTTLVPNLYVARAALADVATTNANLTGPITSIGNATSVASQTGTGSVFVMQASPVLTTPNIGVASGTSLATTGDITAGVFGSTGVAILSAGGAGYSGYLQLSSAAGIRQGYIGYSTTTAATDAGTIPYVAGIHAFTGVLQATNAVLASPTLTTPNIGVATGTSFQGIIGNVTPAAGAFTNVGVGIAAVTNLGVSVASTNLTSIYPVAYSAGAVFPSTATGIGFGFYSAVTTAAAAFTLGALRHFHADVVAAGAGSTIDSVTGFYAENFTAGGSNYGFFSTLSSGSGKWNFYAFGTANNAFVGNVRIGSLVAPTVALDVTGAINSTLPITVSGVSLGDAEFRATSATTQAALRLESTFTSGTGGNNKNWAIVQSFAAYGDLVFRISTAEGGNARTAGTTIASLTSGGLDIAGNVNVSAGSAYQYNGANVITAQTALNNYYFAGAGNLTGAGIYNLGIGGGALANVNGNINFAAGENTLGDVTTGFGNCGIGYNTGRGITTGNGNTILGAQVTGLAANLTNNIILASGDGVIKARHDGANWTLTGEIRTAGAAAAISIDRRDTSVKKWVLYSAAGEFSVYNNNGGATPFIIDDAAATNTARITGTGLSVTGNVSVTGTLTRSGNVSAASWTTTGIGIITGGSTFTDTSTAAAGVAATNHINVFAAPTIASTNAATTTTAATVYIAGAPIAGANQTITNAHALHVVGDIFLNGSVAIGGTAIDPTAGLTTALNVVDPSGRRTGASFIRTLILSAPNARDILGGTFTVTTSANAFNATGVLAGAALTGQNSNTATVTNMYGGDMLVYNVGAGTITNGCAGNFSIQNLNASGTIANAYGARIGLGFNVGILTNTYGVYVGTLTGGTQTNAPYAFYAADTAARNYFGGNVGIGAIAAAARLQMAGNVSAASWTTSGIGLRIDAATYTDTSTAAAGTAASNHINVFAAPTIVSTNAATTTTAATVYIGGAPVAGTNQTITNRYALQVASGAVAMGTGRLLSAQGATVSSASNLVLGSDGNRFQVGGSVPVNLLANTNWQGGAEATLLFQSTLFVSHNQTASGNNRPIFLSGGAGIVTYPKAQVRLQYDSTDLCWYQIGGLDPVMTPTVFAPLNTGLLLNAGTGNPTFTRASVATFSDWERINSVVSGEGRFTGGRRVANLIGTSSENATTAGSWALHGGVPTITLDTTDFPSGATKSTQISTTQIYSGVKQAAIVTIGRTYRARWAALSTVAGKIMVLSNTIDTDIATITLTTAWVEYSALFTATQTPLGWLVKENAATTIKVSKIQIEEVTGQSNQAPSEYVSVGVLSSPWQGAGVDGIQYFATQNGNTVAANVVTEATGAALTGMLGYLAEPASTNLALSSEAFNNAYWNPYGALSVTDNVFNAPNGNMTAALLACVAGNGMRSNNLGATAGNTYTASVYAYPLDSGAACFLEATCNGGAGASATITQSLTAGVWTKVTATVIAGVGDTWIQIGARNDASARRYYIWGAQLETGPIATSYIPTTTAAVTRNIDVESYPVAGNVATNNVTIYTEWTPIAAAASIGTVFLWGSYVDASNYTAILYDGTNIIFRKRIAGVNTDATKALAVVAGTTYKMAARASSATGQDVFVNGVIGTTHTNTTALQLGATYQVGADGNGASSATGNLRNHRVYSTALLNSSIALF